MTRYEIYQYIHVAAATVWVGGAFLVTVLVSAGARAGDEQLGRIFTALGDLSKIFAPASIALLLGGILMVVDGPWSFETPWIAIGLAGILGGFAFGIAVISPVVKRIAAEIEASGGTFTARAAAEARRMLVLQRFDTLILFVIVAAMVMKPTGDDTGMLAAMAAVFVAGLVYMGLRLRAMQEPSTPEPASA